ncbi:hypothetical protein LMUR_13744 [Listeria grayi FSL F6-1183]|uniref:Uncharacterized protein n=1 Tax=Listeria grayi FSL F6-1183 TaxID=1265827 RepID=A0A829R577_LISGR|nr:hypothetical protein LMUR_13744 [Listeria grayi FSL F6-1183]
MIPFLEDSLKEIQKNTEKKMIHLFTASQANATSENRKLLIKEQKKELRCRSRKQVQELFRQICHFC